MRIKLSTFLLSMLLLTPFLASAKCQDEKKLTNIFLSLHSAAVRGDAVEYRKIRESSIVEEMENNIKERKLGTFSEAIRKFAQGDAGVSEMKYYSCTASGSKARLVISNGKKPSNDQVAKYMIIIFSKDGNGWRVGNYGDVIISGNSAKSRVEDYYSHQYFSLKN